MRRDPALGRDAVRPGRRGGVPGGHRRRRRGDGGGEQAGGSSSGRRRRDHGSKSDEAARDIQRARPNCGRLYEVAQTLSSSLGLHETLEILGRSWGILPGTACLFLLRADADGGAGRPDRRRRQQRVLRRARARSARPAPSLRRRSARSRRIWASTTRTICCWHSPTGGLAAAADGADRAHRASGRGAGDDQPVPPGGRTPSARTTGICWRPSPSARRWRCTTACCSTAPAAMRSPTR